MHSGWVKYFAALWLAVFLVSQLFFLDHLTSFSSSSSSTNNNNRNRNRNFEPSKLQRNYDRVSPSPASPSARPPPPPSRQPPTPTPTPAKEEPVPPVERWNVWKADPLNPNPTNKICSASRCKIIAGGYTRSSSTWQFNVLKLLMKEATGLDESKIHFAHGHDIKELKAVLDVHSVSIVKLHEYFDPRTVKENEDGDAVFVFTSIRDPRDSAASCYRLKQKGTNLISGTATSCEHLVKKYFVWYQNWLPFSDYDMSYVASVLNPIQEISNMAQVLGITHLTEKDFEAIHQRIKTDYKKEAGKGNSWSRKTGFNSFHITDSNGGIGAFTQVLSEKSKQDLNRHFGRWLCAFGFARCIVHPNEQNEIRVVDEFHEAALQVPYFGFQPSVTGISHLPLQKDMIAQGVEVAKGCTQDQCKILVVSSFGDASDWLFNAMRLVLENVVGVANEDFFVSSFSPEDALSSTGDLIRAFRHHPFVLVKASSSPSFLFEDDEEEEEHNNAFFKALQQVSRLGGFVFTSQRDPRNIVAECQREECFSSSLLCKEAASFSMRQRQRLLSLSDHDSFYDRCFTDAETELRDLVDALHLYTDVMAMEEEKWNQLLEELQNLALRRSSICPAS
ncbi:hypothetical protein QOT17_019259 [Balamuthia mandrillaris]